MLTHNSTIKSFFLDGPAGRLEALLNAGAEHATHAAVVCHPHPLFGGTLHNKVVFQCAGINRLEVEDERALRERSSDPLGLESCAATARDTAKRRQRIGGVGIQLRKDAIRTPTSL